MTLLRASLPHKHTRRRGICTNSPPARSAFDSNEAWRPIWRNEMRQMLQIPAGEESIRPAAGCSATVQQRVKFSELYIYTTQEGWSLHRRLVALGPWAAAY